MISNEPSINHYLWIGSAAFVNLNGEIPYKTHQRWFCLLLNPKYLPQLITHHCCSTPITFPSRFLLINLYEKLSCLNPHFCLVKSPIWLVKSPFWLVKSLKSTMFLPFEPFRPLPGLPIRPWRRWRPRRSCARPCGPLLQLDLTQQKPRKMRTFCNKNY